MYLHGLIYNDFDNSLILFGGMKCYICTSLNLMYKINLNKKIYENNWSLMKIKLPIPISAHGYCKIKIDNNNIWLIIIGGGKMVDKKPILYYNTIFVYDMINSKFYKLNETIPETLAGVSCVYDSINSNLHIIGGTYTKNKKQFVSNKHLCYNIGMKQNKQNKKNKQNTQININPIKYRKNIWTALAQASKEINSIIPKGIWQIIFDMIDDGLLLPLLVKKPYLK